jgi:hypothetical protein
MKNRRLFSFLMLAIMIAPFSFYSCDSDDDAKDELSANDKLVKAVSENLILHFNFEDNADDVAGKRKGTATDKVKYTKGWIGKAYQGAEGASIKVPLTASDDLQKLTSFTYSVWLDLPDTWDGGAGGIFFLADTKDFWGNIALFNDGYSEGDSVMIKTFFNKSDATKWKGQWIESKRDFPKTKWFHLAASYDAATSVFKFYVNGKAIFEDIRTDGPALDANGEEIVVAPEDPYTVKEAAKNKLGALKFTQCDYFLIGDFHQVIFGSGDDWMKNFAGQIDELKIYNKSLTDEEVSAVFNAELNLAD